MKKFLTSALSGLFALLALGACTEEETPAGEITLVEGEQSVTFYADEWDREVGLSFETNGTWRSSVTETDADGDSVTPDWIRINPLSGNAPGTYQTRIIADGNYTGAARSATIVIRCGEALIEIAVAQAGVTARDEFPVGEVTLNPPRAEMAVGETIELSAEVAPEIASSHAVAWSSAEPAVAGVDANGRVVALAEGTAMIVATSVQDRRMADTCQVSVRGVRIADLVWATRNADKLQKDGFAKTSWSSGGYFTFEAAGGACPAGWRTPTADEWRGLIATGGEWMSVNGAAGRSFGDRFGIFIPAAGYSVIVVEEDEEEDVKEQREIRGKGVLGRLWSSTDEATEGAAALAFDEDGAAVAVYPNDYGYNVRCVVR